MQTPPKESNLCDEHGKLKRNVIFTDYNQHLYYVNKGHEWLTAL
jgi:hypothetical protein